MADDQVYHRERDVIGALSSALEGLRNVEYVTERETHSKDKFAPDAEIDISVGGTKLYLVIEAKSIVYPRDVPRIVWQLRHAQHDFLPDRSFVPFVAGEAISEGARDLLRAENVGFFDKSGTLFIPAGTVYVDIERGAPKPLARSIRSLFEGKRSRILHALLLNPGSWFGVTNLANLAAVSPATASETLAELDQSSWTEIRGRGPSKERRLANGSELLDQWQKQIVEAKIKNRPPRRYYVAGADTAEVARRLAEFCETDGLNYAVTGEFAAQLYAPFLTRVRRVAAWFDREAALARVANSLGARAVVEGANLELLLSNSGNELLFKGQRDGLWLASQLQVYLDLIAADGRSKEMADHLRQERLGI